MTIYIIGISLAIILYIFGKRALFKYFKRILGKELLRAFELTMALLALTLFIAVLNFALNVYAVFALFLALFLTSLLALILGSRHVLEEYLTGNFATKTYGLRVGDYVELDKVRGYIVSVDETSIVIRDPQRDLVYIPYTALVHNPFKKVRIEEGHEIRLPIFVPYGVDLKKMREELANIANSYGVENFRVDVESIGAHGVTLVARGVLRDPRREDDLKYELLDRAYAIATLSGQTQ